MRKFGLIFAVVFLLSPAAWAFSPAGEEMVYPVTQEIVYASPSDEMANAVSGLSRDVKNLKKSNTSSMKKMNKRINENTNAITSVAKSVSGLTGEIKSLPEKMKNNMLVIVMVIVIAAAITIIVIVNHVSKTSKSTEILDAVNKLGEKIDEVPEKTATKVKTLDPVVIDLKDIKGKNVVYTPPIIDGMYVSLYVPSTVSATPATPAETIRVRVTDVGALRRSTRKAMADYFAAKATGAPAPGTEQGKQQLALIDHLITTGEVVVS